MQINRLSGGMAKLSSTSGKKSAEGKKQPEAASVRVSVGSAADLREKALSMFGDIAAVRIDEIDAIRERIAQGDYHVDEKRVAAKIVSNALLERPWS